MANDYAPPTYDEVQAALSYIPTPATHNEWYPIAIAIKDALGENGFTLWDEWSRQGKGYNSSVVKSTWKSATPKPGGITAATLFRLARDNGYRPERPYVPPTPEQMAAREAEQRARDEAAASELADTRRQAAKKAYGIWKNADKTVDLNHAYLQRKGIAETELVRGIRQNEYQGQRQLVIPLYQGGELVSVQTINEAGGKHFLKGGEKSGSYAVLGNLEREAHKGIVLAEGFATAASIRKATGAPVVIAFDSGNMIRIAENMATRLPETQRVILAADNDPSGTGLAAASQAAVILGGRARIALPDFSPETVARFQAEHGAWDEKRDRENLPTDFNDLHLAAGIDAVKAQMATALPQPERQPETAKPTAQANLTATGNTPFVQAVDKVVSGNVPAGYISLGTTPDVLQMLGVPQGKVRISGGTIEKSVADYLNRHNAYDKNRHAVNPEDLKLLPGEINDPVAVFKSSTQSNSFVVLTQLYERENGKEKPMIAAVHLSKGKGKHGADLIDVVSVYGRSDTQLERAFQNDLLYANEKKVREFLTTHPLQLHWDITSKTELSSRNIKTESDLAQWKNARRQPETAQVSETPLPEAAAPDAAAFSMPAENAGQTAQEQYMAQQPEKQPETPTQNPLHPSSNDIFAYEIREQDGRHYAVFTDTFGKLFNYPVVPAQGAQTAQQAAEAADYTIRLYQNDNFISTAWQSEKGQAKVYGWANLPTFLPVKTGREPQYGVRYENNGYPKSVGYRSDIERMMQRDALQLAEKQAEAAARQPVNDWLAQSGLSAVQAGRARSVLDKRIDYRDYGEMTRADFIRERIAEGWTTRRGTDARSGKPTLGIWSPDGSTGYDITETEKQFADWLAQRQQPEYLQPTQETAMGNPAPEKQPENPTESSAPSADPEWEQTVADQRRLDSERRAERAPWRDFPPVIRNGGLGSLKNEPEYAAAKGGDDIEAGRLVNKLLKEETVQQFREMIGDRKPVIVSVSATESAGRNKIPLAMAQALGSRLDLPVDTDIQQINKVSRTGSGIDHRLAFQPVFDGHVEAGRDYLIVDDTLAVGGTVAALRGYIENRGGHVVGAGVMTAHEGALNLPVKQAMIDNISRKHGNAMDNYWKEEFGYGIDQLTQGEAGHLNAARDVEQIRDRIAEARFQGIARPTEQTLPLSPGQQERPDGIAPEPNQAAAPDAAAFSMPAENAGQTEQEQNMAQQANTPQAARQPENHSPAPAESAPEAAFAVFPGRNYGDAPRAEVDADNRAIHFYESDFKKYEFDDISTNIGYRGLTPEAIQQQMDKDPVLRGYYGITHNDGTVFFPRNEKGWSSPQKGKRPEATPELQEAAAPDAAALSMSAPAQGESMVQQSEKQPENITTLYNSIREVLKSNVSDGTELVFNDDYITMPSQPVSFEYRKGNHSALLAFEIADGKLEYEAHLMDETSDRTIARDSVDINNQEANKVAILFTQVANDYFNQQAQSKNQSIPETGQPETAQTATAAPIPEAAGETKEENGIEYGGSRTQDAVRSEPETITASEVQENLRRIRSAERLQDGFRQPATPKHTGIPFTKRPEPEIPAAVHKDAEPVVETPAKPKPVLDLNYETAAGLDARYVRYDGRYLDPNNARTVLFEDKGAKIKTAREDAQTISDMLDTAQAKNWDSIRISGSREFKRQMWLEAELRGIPNSGYAPSKEDLAMRDQMRAARERNSIEAGGINRTAEPSARNPSPRQPENRQSAHSPSEQLVADDSVRLKSEAANLQTRAETPEQTRAANRAAETAVQAAGERQSVPEPDTGRAADKPQDPSAPNHALEAARAAYLAKADKLSKAAKEQLANHERDFAEAVKGIPENKHESAMLNFYTGMQKRMNGTKLDMPEPTAAAERNRTQPEQQPGQPKRRDDGMDMDR